MDTIKKNLIRMVKQKKVESAKLFHFMFHNKKMRWLLMSRVNTLLQISNMFRRDLLTFMFFILLVPSFRAQDNKLWYNKPGTDWESEKLPIGNGRMGAMLSGGIKNDTIQFNEQTLWSGENNWDGEYETGDLGFGSYRNFGEICISFELSGEEKSYSRSLDLINAIHTVGFKLDKVDFCHEAFASSPDQVLVFRYTASRKGSLSGKIQLNSAQGANTVLQDTDLSFSGAMPNKLEYAAVLKVLNTDGTLSEKKDTLCFNNCTSLTLILAATTNYKADYYAGWRGDSPLPKVKEVISKASKKNYAELKANHVKDFSQFMNRVTLNLGTSSYATRRLPVNERLKQYSILPKDHESRENVSEVESKRIYGSDDPDLEETLFQYGRYLLLSSSRPGGLPANLQGLWNKSNNPPWASDYHNNINIQMNYWPAETTNLSECALPLIDFIISQSVACKIASKKSFGNNVRGWTARTSQSIFGGNGWEWNIPASAWYAQHAYEHWAFTKDSVFLIEKALPILKEVCEFWDDRLKKREDGMLVAPDGWSPEHGPREDGVMHDQQIIWDLFQNYLDVTAFLDTDSLYRQHILELQASLAPNKIGKWGQLQEWQEDRDDPEDNHRHTSHLFAVFPGRQISTVKTPELANAALVSLLSRSGCYQNDSASPFYLESTSGDSRRSWTWPWRCALWARLGNGENAYINLRGLLTYNTLPNLFCNHPPFQLDGNFGIAAGMAEMLVQSHAGIIQLLPAIPADWSESGSFKGLKARGGFTIDCSWKNGKVKRVKIYSVECQSVNVMIGGKAKAIRTHRL